MMDGKDRASEGAELMREDRGYLIPKVPDHIRAVHAVDGGTALDIQHGQMFRLNATASRVLDLIKQGFGEAAIAEQLAGEFGVERERAVEDVHDFIQMLVKHHLVTYENRIVAA